MPEAPTPPERLVDMSGSLPAGLFLAMTAAVRYLHQSLDAPADWAALPDWLCVNNPDDAKALQNCLAGVCDRLEPVAQQLAHELRQPADPAAPRLTLVKKEAQHDP